MATFEYDAAIGEERARQNFRELAAVGRTTLEDFIRVKDARKLLNAIRRQKKHKTI